MVGRRKRREAKESEPRRVTVSPTRMENMDFRLLCPRGNAVQIL